MLKMGKGEGGWEPENVRIGFSLPRVRAKFLPSALKETNIIALANPLLLCEILINLLLLSSCVPCRYFLLEKIVYASLTSNASINPFTVSFLQQF